MQKVLRIHKSHKKQGYEEVYAELLLFFPWTDEETDLHANDEYKCKALFNAKREIVRQNKKCIYPYSETIEEVSLKLESAENNRPEHVGDSLNAAGEQENYDLIPEIEEIDNAELPEINESTHREKHLLKPIIVESDDVMLSMARNASHEQMVVLGKMVDYSKRVLI